MQAGPGAKRSARVRLVALLIAVVNIFGGLLASVLSLRHDADDARQARVLLAQVDAAATDLAHHGSDCAVMAALGCGRPETQVSAALNGLVERVAARLPPGGTEQELRRAIGEANPGPDGVTAGRWLERVRRATAQASRVQAVSARRTSTLADVETGLLMIISLAVALTLFRRFEATRRQGELRAAAERARSEARFRGLVTHASDLILVCDQDGAVQYHSPSVAVLATAAEGPLSLPDLILPEDLPGFTEALAGALGHGVTQLRHTARWRRRDGGVAWIEAVVTDLRHEPEIRGLVVNGHDVTDARELEEQLRKQAFTDPLTGLANRALFADRVEQALVRDGDRVTLLYLDLDRFKAVNDTLGHGAGDDVLVRVADTLRAVLRPADTAARLGGDEFAVLLAPEPDGTEGTGPGPVADRILEALGAGRVRASIGIVRAGDDGAGNDLAGNDLAGPEDLMRRADLAMYVAKGDGGHRWVRFEADLHAARLERTALGLDLVGAAERGELRALYQPTVDIGSGRLLGVEALVRWVHPVKGLLSPVLFIPIAEENGAIVEVGRWILRTACAEVRGWQQRNPRHGASLRLSVNLSTRQLLDPNLVAEVRDILAETAFPPTLLTLEVTETQLVEDRAGAISVLDDLRDLGCAVAIDDFGTGYSSLSYLEQLPIDTLKIDRSFVQRLSTSDEARVLVQSIVSMARGLGMSLIAEGVEEASQAAELTRLGCMVGQGFLWARPLPPGEVEAMLRGGGYLAATVEDRAAGEAPAAAQHGAGVPTPRSPRPTGRTAAR